MTEPMIHRQMSEDDYRAVPALSRSDLMSWFTGGRGDDRHLFIGTLFHRMVLEPDRLLDTLLVCEERRNTKAWKAFCEANKGRDVVTTGEFDMLRGMKLSIEATPEVAVLADYAKHHRDDCELVVVAPYRGVMMKARLDMLTPKAIVDWKTTGCMNSDDFAGSIAAFDYDVQAYLYRQLYAAATGGEDRLFAFAAASKRGDAEYPCWVHVAGETEQGFGQRMADKLIDAWKYHNPGHEAIIREFDDASE